MRKEMVADVIKETAKELAKQVCEHIGIPMKNSGRCEFNELNSSIVILEVRKKLRPAAEDVNLFLLLSNEIYDLKKRIKELEGSHSRRGRGLTVNQVSKDSVGATPSEPTKDKK